jgi:antitoxin component YwqK of YwqJK toxin-antitoxin module
MLFFFLVSVLLSLFSCNQKNSKKEFQNDKGQLIIQEWYSLDKLKSETTYLKSDKSEYVYVAYNEDGRMIDSGRYVNDTITGFHKFYEDKTKLTHFENYKNGLLNGPHKAVYTGGVTSFEGYHKDGFSVGQWKFHYPDGRMITYEYYDSTGKVKYFRKYDDEGNTVKITGNGIIGVFIQKPQTDTIKGIVEVAVPDNCKCHLKITGNENTIFENFVSQPRVSFSFVNGDTVLDFQLIITKQNGQGRKIFIQKKLLIIPGVCL